MDDVRWKSDKHCEECKNDHRKKIVSELKESCGNCPAINKIDKEKRMKGPKKRSGKWK